MSPLKSGPGLFDVPCVDVRAKSLPNFLKLVEAGEQTTREG